MRKCLRSNYVAVFVVLVLLLNSGSVMCWSEKDSELPELTQAHKALLENDQVTMCYAISKVLAKHYKNNAIVANVAQLLEKAYIEGNGEIFAGNDLPSGIGELKLVSETCFDETETIYTIGLFATLNEGAKVKSTVVTLYNSDYPGEIVLDTVDEETYSIHEKGDFFEVLTLMDEQPANGLYRIQMELENGDNLETFVPVLHWEGERAEPDVIAPAMNAVLKTPNPEISWNTYHSDSKGLFLKEYVAEVLYVDYEYDDWDQCWVKYGDGFDAGSATVGLDQEAEGDEKLEPGDYSVSMRFVEERLYGKIFIARDTSKIVPFSVSE